MADNPQRFRVGAVILHYNHPEMTSNCLESLRHQTYPLEQIVLVDNGSDDPVQENIPDLGPRLHQLCLAENRGFAGGVNAGIQWLRAHAEVDAVWLLNNDTVCEPTVLDTLTGELMGHPETGAVSAAMEERDEDGSRLVITGGRFPLPFRVPFVSRPGERVDYLCGACLLLRGKAIEQVGLLDENYFFFFEDVDWCFRARRQGWRLRVSENSCVRHLRSSTIGQLPRLRTAYYRRSYIRFLRQYSKAPVRLAFLTTAYRLLTDALHARWAACAGTLDGWRDAWQPPPPVEPDRKAE